MLSFQLYSINYFVIGISFAISQILYGSNPNPNALINHIASVEIFSSKCKISLGFSRAKSVNKGTTCLAVTAGSSPLPSYYGFQSKCETKLPPPLSATEISHSELVSRAKIPMLGVIVCLHFCLVFPQIYNGMNDH